MSRSTNKPLRVAYLTGTDPLDRRNWAGVHYYMLKHLGKVFDEVVPLGPAKSPMLRASRHAAYRLNELSLRLSGTRYDVHHNFLVSHAYARFFGKKLRAQSFDLVFAPAGTGPGGLLRTDVPIIYFGDATVGNLRDYYPEFTNLHPWSQRESDWIERQALREADKYLFSSEWALNSAVRNYGADPEKVDVLSFGANVERIPSSVLGSKSDLSICQLLFLGAGWACKGGQIALEALRDLRARGVAVHLTVCGCVPPETDPDMTVIPFLNKNKPEELARIEQLLAESHFMLLPTRADCTPVVFCEAAAYGLPVVTTATGGVASVVREGINGFALPHQAKGGAYADVIAATLADPERYQALVLSSRQEYETRLNWQTFARRVRAYYDEIAAERS